MCLLNTKKILQDFPMLCDRKIDGWPFIYLDSAATTQKPQAVIHAISHFYKEEYATVQRSIYHVALASTEKYSFVRQKVQKFIRASREEEIVFTRGTTESLNLIAFCYGREFLKQGDEIVITEMEHHSNIVPWQMLCKEIEAKLIVIPMDHCGNLNIEEFAKKLSHRTKIVSFCHVSNVLGTVNSIQDIVALSRQVGAIIVVDGAQSVAHLEINVKELDVDFFVFSAHKLYGPTGVGVLYGKYVLLEKMRPYHGGGGMVQEVTFSASSYQPPPLKFEAGTPPIAEIIGLGAAIDYLNQFSFVSLQKEDKKLIDVALEGFSCLKPYVKVCGTPKERVGIITFSVQGVHSFDLGVLMGCKGVALRTGSMCANPTLLHFGLQSAARISFGMYNGVEDVQQFFFVLDRVLHDLQKR